MEYEKKDGKVIGKLNQKNVDTGAGLERMTAVMQGVRTAYDTDIFKDVINLIKEKSENYNEKYARVVADHLRTSLFMVADGVIPSNKDRGYILRRLIRRATVRSLKLKFSGAVSLDVTYFSCAYVKHDYAFLVFSRFYL
jgi:alanyl-tRNA synthetase